MILKEDIGKEKEIICNISKLGKPYIKVKSAKFECPSCGTVMSVIQLEKKFREPKRCSCGRRGGFKVISKELIEAQELKICEKETDFEYKVYVVGLELIDKIKALDPNRYLKLTGEIQDEYKKDSTQGEFIILCSNVECKEEDTPAFLR